MTNKSEDLIREVFSRFIKDENELNAVFQGKPISETVSIDSLTMLHLVTDLEKAFGVRFDLDTIEQTFMDISSLQAFLEG